MIQRQRGFGYAIRVSARSYRQVPLYRRRGKMTGDDRVAVAAGSVVMLVYAILALLLLAIYTCFTVFNLVSPGVQAGGVRLGGLTEQQAADKLTEAWKTNSSINLTDGKRTWPVPPASLGFKIDSKATVRNAAQVGRVAGGWLNPFSVLFGDQRVTPVVKFDENAAREGLEKIASRLNAAPVEAAIYFRDQRWGSTPGKNGTELDLDGTLTAWRSNPAELLRMGVLPVKMRVVAPQVLDASSKLARLQNLMQSPLTISAYDPITDETIHLQIPSEITAGWIKIDGDGGEPVLSLNADEVNTYLQGQQDALGAERYLDGIQGLDDLDRNWQEGRPLTALVKHHPTTYTIQAGDNLVSIAFKTGIPWWKIRDANPDVNPNALSTGQQITIPSKDVNLPEPVVLNKRIVISISQQRLWTYENGQRRSESVISTGISRSPTMPGVFQIQTHDINAYASNWDLYMPHFMGIYEAAPGFMNGLHGLPLLSSGVRLWADVLGRPASYGCIILTLSEAEDLYNWAENGVVVEIQP